MARVKRGVAAHARHKRVPRSGEGLLRPPQEYHPHRAAGGGKRRGSTPTRDRKTRKRNFRALWIQRINAGVRELGLTYGRFMHGCKLLGLELDRKVLADLALNEPDAFRAIVEQVRGALPAEPVALAA